jgi:hypothetical protein
MIPTKKQLREKGNIEGINNFIDGATASKADQASQEKKALGRPAKEDKDEYTKSTFVIRKTLQTKVRVAAALAGVEQRQILEDALTAYFADKQLPG